MKDKLSALKAGLACLMMREQGGHERYFYEITIKVISEISYNDFITLKFYARAKEISRGVCKNGYWVRYGVTQHVNSLLSELKKTLSHSSGGGFYTQVMVTPRILLDRWTPLTAKLLKIQ